MIQGIGREGLAQAAIEAALRSVAQRTDSVDATAAGGLDAANVAKNRDAALFEKSLLEGLRQVDAAVKRTDELPVAMVGGQISDFHEVAGQVKQAEIAFKFALEVRNKLIDAYRETMRMSV